MASPLRWFGYVALIVSALIGFVTLLVMVLMPDVRANVSFKPSSCLVEGKRIENNPSGSGESRGCVQVSYSTPRYGHTTSIAYDDLDGDYSPGNKTEYLSNYIVGHVYDCFFSPNNHTQVTFQLKHRVVTITFLAISLLMIVAIPIIVCIYTFLCNKKNKDEPQMRFDLYTPEDNRDSIRAYKNLFKEEGYQRVEDE